MSQFPNIEFVLPWSSLQAQDEEEEDEEPDIYPAQDTNDPQDDPHGDVSIIFPDLFLMHF